jgi:NAD(P)-dependent dehydrogenase (short-subunit alcohol dehydrogenase family)
MILITGASRGIGHFFMERFISQGETVFGTYNHTIPDKKYSKNLSKVDISVYAEVQNWIAQLPETSSKIVLLNCAGVNYNAFAHKADPAKWAKVINTNLIGTFNVINATLPVMRDQNYGRIINFSSVVAQMGIPGTSAYAASKSALWGMTKSIAVENAKKGITINSLNLGYFNIGMIGDVPGEFQDVIKSKIPTGDFGNPENIWNAVQFIIKSDYLNGSGIDINAALH